MGKKKNVWKWIVLIIVMLAIGTAGFLIGQGISDSKYREEKELNYKLNLSDLDGLGEIDGTAGLLRG